MEDLGQKCIHFHAVKIAKKMSEWKITGAFLGISCDDVNVIEANNKNDEALMRIRLLEKWLNAQGDEATYLKLFEALDHSERIDLIVDCLELLETGE